jgi:hypothetical protein
MKTHGVENDRKNDNVLFRVFVLSHFRDQISARGQESFFVGWAMSVDASYLLSELSRPPGRGDNIDFIVNWFPR